jgi:hypothetical protein
MHLSPDELVDLAEGTRPESSAPHLASCAPCRARLNEMRTMMSAVADVDVPEPSPLFWDHFSERVHNAVEDARLKGSRSFGEGAHGSGSFSDAAREFVTTVLGTRAFQAGVVAALALIIVVLATSRIKTPDNPRTPATTDAGIREVWADGVAPDAAADASLTLVASLTAGMDLEAVNEAGLAHDDSAEHAVTHMSDGELRELQKLLKEEMARSGA